MRLLALVVLLLVPVAADAATGSAAVDTWYLRPAGACANNGDGLAYGCAASAGATGAFIDMPNVIYTATIGVDDGDVLYICGLHDNGTSFVPTAAGTATAKIRLNFDCPGDPGTIRNVTTMAEALTSGNWTNESGNLWYLSVASYTYKDPRRIWLNDIEIVPSNSKANLGTRINNPSAPISTFWYDSGNSRIYLYSVGNPATGLTSMKSLVANGAGNYAAMRIPSVGTNYYRIINPRLEGGHFSSFYSLGNTGVSIEGTDLDSCRIGKHGVKGAFFADSNGNGTGTANNGGLIKTCTLDPEIGPGYEGYAWEINWGLGDGLDIAFGVTNFKGYDLHINGWPHSNLYPRATSGTTSISNIYVYDSLLTCTGYTSYCRAFAVDGNALGRATNVWLFSNTFSGFHNRSQFNGNGNFLIANKFLDMKPDLVYANRNEMLGFQGYSGASQDNVVAQNYFGGNPYAPCIAWRDDPTAITQNYLIVNNIFHNCGGPYVTNFEYVAISLPTAANIGNQTLKNNLIRNDSGAVTIYYKGTGKTTLAGLQSACSGDVCSGNLESNPMMLSSDDLRSQVNSPLRRSGVWWGNECMDFRHRPCWSKPDIGPYQASSGDLAKARRTRTH